MKVMKTCKIGSIPFSGIRQIPIERNCAMNLIIKHHEKSIRDVPLYYTCRERERERYFFVRMKIIDHGSHIMERLVHMRVTSFLFFPFTYLLVLAMCPKIK